jgi:hypothetical protein
MVNEKSEKKRSKKAVPTIPVEAGGVIKTPEVKKRGRKKGTANATVVDKIAPAKTEVKKRGRKKGSLALKISKDLTKNKPEPKKRGRKKGSVNTRVKTNKVEIKPEAKKRGRKKGTVVKQNVNLLNLISGARKLSYSELIELNVFINKFLEVQKQEHFNRLEKQLKAMKEK